MQVTKEVNEVIVAAIEYARENKHEYVTAEHILYKCTFIEKVQNAMEKCGADIENLRKNNDYAMWLEAVKKVDCYRYPKCLSYYIKHDGSISSGSKIKLIKWHYKLFREGLKKNALLSGIYTINNLFHGVVKKIIYKEKTDTIPNILESEN